MGSGGVSADGRVARVWRSCGVKPDFLTVVGLGWALSSKIYHFWSVHLIQGSFGQMRSQSVAQTQFFLSSTS